MASGGARDRGRKKERNQCRNGELKMERGDLEERKGVEAKHAKEKSERIQGGEGKMVWY